MTSRARRRVARASWVCAHAAAVVFHAVPASANGRYPAADQIVVDPTDPNHIVVRATYGLLTTRDAGAHWTWTCEAALGFSSEQDPPIAVSANGSLAAGLLEGLAVTHGDGCTWTQVAGLAQRPVVDVSTIRAEPSSMVALSWSSIEDDTTMLWRSDDNAVTWALSGATLPAGFAGITVDVAPSDSSRIVASGRIVGASAAGVAVSSDGGASWHSMEVPGSDSLHPPYLGAIHPTDPDVFYVRIRGDHADTLLVSSDAGATWSQIFQGTGGLFGFALSPDGSTVLVGGQKDGLWRASTADHVFAPVSNVGVLCLAWSGSSLYACADENKDGFTVGRSTDGGASFTPIMHRSDPSGPPTCGAGTSVGTTCPALWPATRCTLDATGCASSSGGDVGVTEPPATGGCGCAAADPSRRVEGAAAVLALALAAARRRGGSARRGR